MQRQALDQIFEFEDHHWWFRARRAIVQKVLGGYLSGRNNKILEVGCGSGGNFDLLSSFGKVWALEQDDEARTRAVARNLATVDRGSLPNHIPVDHSFDLICLLDVLEHVEQDEQALVALNGHLADNGMLLVTVPAYAFLWSGHDELNRHKRRYTRTPLLHLIRRSGFTPLYATYFNSVLFPIVAGVRIAKNRILQIPGTDFQEYSALTNRLLFWAMSSERLIMPRLSLPFGVSILVLAQKTSD